MFLFGGFLTLDCGPFISKAVECSKHCLTGHNSRTMKDNGDDIGLNCGDHEVSETKNVSMWTRDWLSNILGKNVAVLSGKSA